MKIDRVILSSDTHECYLPFWEYAAKSWLRIGVKPTLFFTDKQDAESKSRSIKKIGDVYHFNCDNMDTAFVAQNIRLLAPCLFPNESVIIADIDHFPLSKKYFIENVAEYEDDSFICYRTGVCGPTQMAMSWNLARGSTWSEIFGLNINESNWHSEIKNRLLEWYPSDYQPIHHGEHTTWYTDQILLRKYVSAWADWAYDKTQNRFIELHDNQTGFYRLDKSHDGDRHTTIFNSEHLNLYSDFIPPRPLSEHRMYIEDVLSYYDIASGD